MAHFVGSTVSGTFFLKDPNTGVPITGAVSGDFDVPPVASLGPSGATTADVTITERSGGLGRYGYSFTPSAAGDWDYYHDYDGSNLWQDTFDIIAIAGDILEIADAVAAVQTTVDTIDGNVDVAVSTRASAAVWTSGRAERLDRIGADSVTVRSATAASELIEVRQGADYTVSADNALEWDVTTDTDLSPVGTVVTLTISSRSLQGADAITTTCTVTNPAAATKTITAELTDTQTALLRTAEFTRYQVDAQIGTDMVPLIEGRVKVLPSLA